jgi:hypothetical protein
LERLILLGAGSGFDLVLSELPLRRERPEVFGGCPDRLLLSEEPLLLIR